MSNDPADHMGDSYGRDDPSGCLSGCLTMFVIGVGGTILVAIAEWISPVITSMGHF